MPEPRLTYMDRTVTVQNVAWVRTSDGHYIVTWTENGVPKTATFRREKSAIRLVNYLDTSGAQPSYEDVREAERALRELDRLVGRETAAEKADRYRAERSLAELEETMAELEQAEAEEALMQLEPYVQRRAPRHSVKVRSHSRRR